MLIGHWLSSRLQTRLAFVILAINRIQITFSWHFNKKNISDGIRASDKYENWVPEKIVVVRKPIQVNSRWKWVIEQQISRWLLHSEQQPSPPSLSSPVPDWPTSTPHLVTLGGREGEASCTQIPVDLGRVLTQIYSWVQKTKKVSGRESKWRREEKKKLSIIVWGL